MFFFCPQETDRLETIYPTLKEVGLAGSSGSKAAKQLALQLSSFAIKAAGEGKIGNYIFFLSTHAQITITLQFLLFSCYFIGVYDAGTPQLSNEGSDIFVWCLTQNHECYKHWVSLFYPWQAYNFYYSLTFTSFSGGY